MLNKFQHIDIMVCYSLSLSFQCDVMMFLCFLWNSFINNCCFYLSNFFFFTQGNWHRAGCRFGYFAEISKNYWKWQVNIVLLLFIQHNKTPKIKVVFEEIFLIPLILKIRKKKKKSSWPRRIEELSNCFYFDFQSCKRTLLHW